MSSQGQDTTAGQIATSVRWTALAKGVGQAATFLTTLILARLLNREDFGLFALALFYVGFVEVFIDLGLVNAIIQRKEITRSELSSCFWILTFSSLLFFGAGSMGASVISVLLGHEQLSPVLQILSFAFLLIPLTVVSMGVLSRELKLATVARVELAGAVLRCLLVIYLAFNGYGVLSLAYAFVAERLLVTLLLVAAARWTPSLASVSAGTWSLMGFGLQVTSSKLLWFLYSRLDVLVIGRVLGVEILGVYSLASQLANAFFQFISSAGYRVAFPVFSRHNSIADLAATTLRASQYLAIISLPVFAGIAVTAGDTVAVLLGSRWTDAVVPLQVLAVVAGLQTLSGLLPQAINAAGRPALNTWVNAISVPVFAIGFYLGAVSGGLSGVLLAWLILFPLRYTIVIWLARLATSLKPGDYLNALIRPLAASLCMALVVLAMISVMGAWSAGARLGASVAIGALAYAVASMILFREDFLSLMRLMFLWRKGVRS